MCVEAFCPLSQTETSLLVLSRTTCTCGTAGVPPDLPGSGRVRTVPGDIDPHHRPSGLVSSDGHGTVKAENIPREKLCSLQLFCVNNKFFC
ncbi:Hypp4759 [Branchiostoma lanceolatum]|uniref:Hypp4759 protein n=1 Tax=Branchiostoma lanceolatum TaxID=7740 RepID=A0A8K0AAZ5_BRALA|nr:Hypp4759 [Branchiostoma lanceolatum]